MSDTVRVDKWLWAVRIFKSRSLASDACKTGKIEVQGQIIKPSKMLNIGEVITVKKPPYTFQYKVKGLIGKRVSAKLALENFEDLTSPDELIKVKTIQESAFFRRDRGAGRPTKKERRLIDRFKT